MSSTAPQQLEIDCTERDGRSVITVTGEIDAATSDEFEAGLVPAADAAESVALDLSGVSFIDSSGLRALMAVHQAVSGRGGRIELIAASTVVERLLSVTGLADLFATPS